MAYYTALISAWNTGTVPTGVVGSALTGQSTAQKLININGWTVTATIPAQYNISGSQLQNCINWPELAALTDAQRKDVLLLCLGSNLSVGSSAGQLALIADGMVVAYFPPGGHTITSLSALAPGAQLWWQVSVANGGGGLNSPVTANDLVAAGGLS